MTDDGPKKPEDDKPQSDDEGWGEVAQKEAETPAPSPEPAAEASATDDDPPDDQEAWWGKGG